MPNGVSIVGASPNSQGDPFGYTPERGLWSQRIIEGTYEECLAQALAILQKRSDVSFEVVPYDLPKWRIIIQSPDPLQADQSAFAPIWELDGMDEYPDILSSPKGVALAVANPTDFDRLKNAIKADSDYLETYNALATAEAKDLWNYIETHGETYAEERYILRKNVLIQRAGQVSVSFAGVHKVWSTAQVRAADPTLDAVTLFSINQIEVPTAKTGYTFGWLKKPPSVISEGGGRSRIRQEWWLAQWRNYPYPPFA